MISSKVVNRLVQYCTCVAVVFERRLASFCSAKRWQSKRFLLFAGDSTAQKAQRCFARIFGDSRNLGHSTCARLFTSITLNVDIRLPCMKGLAILATGDEIA